MSVFQWVGVGLLVALVATVVYVLFFAHTFNVNEPTIPPEED